MIKFILPFLMVLLLMGCSTNQVQNIKQNNCGCSSSLTEQFYTFHQESLLTIEKFNENLPEYRKTLLGTTEIKCSDIKVIYPQTEYLNHIVSDKQINTIKNLHEIEYLSKAKEARYLISDTSYQPCQCDVAQADCRTYCR